MGTASSMAPTSRSYSVCGVTESENCIDMLVLPIAYSADIDGSGAVSASHSTLVGLFS